MHGLVPVDDNSDVVWKSKKKKTTTTCVPQILHQPSIFSNNNSIISQVSRTYSNRIDTSTMMKSFFLLASLLVGSSSAQAVGNPVEADVTPIEYMDGNHTLMGHLAVPDGDDMMLPAVIIIP